MSFSPDDIAAREFFPAPDGYDRHEVKAFLRTVASQQRELQIKVEELSRESSGEHDGNVGLDVHKVLESAKQTADEMRRRAEMDAVALRHRAEEEASLLRTSTESATQKLRTEAELYARRLRSAVEQEANERLGHLARRVDRVLAGESRIRDRLFSLESTLQGLRGELQSDAEILYPELPDALAGLREIPAAARVSAHNDQPSADSEERATLRPADPNEPEILIKLDSDRPPPPK